MAYQFTSFALLANIPRRSSPVRIHRVIAENSVMAFKLLFMEIAGRSEVSDIVLQVSQQMQFCFYND